MVFLGDIPTHCLSNQQVQARVTSNPRQEALAGAGVQCVRNPLRVNYHVLPTRIRGYIEGLTAIPPCQGAEQLDKLASRNVEPIDQGFP